ncbi:uncharacterized protein BXZ73DRAFT_80023 [Epithele typhae]|uniref:uncharacterized protein n=1 Tax=Epithele typhae TaxID=378194 RepID=UPI002007264B|nr:uncharacterized protein BXZ73DRAFT_80023 [Epithele typhae]KAH9921258.1 hypothetical protein BXZ73DRAFT_80023 [Epithele typhae]
MPSSAVISRCTVSSFSSALIKEPVDDAVNDFFCHLAVNTASGLYYEHHREGFHEAAMQTSSDMWPNDDAWTEANPFSYVEINGLKIPEPAAAYGLLWEAVYGHDTAKKGHMKIGSKEALRHLSRHFMSGHRVGPSGGHAYVVLMDELDQLTAKQDVGYNFFNWPTLAGSKLVVLAVANTMDLPERVMTGRVRSRLGMIRIDVQPYTTPQMEQIVKAWLAAASLHAGTPVVLAPDAVKFASMKVASISGDARRVLDIYRRADVKEAIKWMQNSPTAAYLCGLGFHERVMLAALVKCVRKEGVEEIQWGVVPAAAPAHALAEFARDGQCDDDCLGRLGASEFWLVLGSLLASHAVICEAGAVVARKAEEERRVALNLGYAEVERVLGEVGGAKWRNVLNV